MLGTGTAGLLATYAIGAVMLVVTFLLGAWWNKRLPSLVKEEGWTTRIVAKIAVLAAVAAAGGMITIPDPATSIRLDSLAGYFGTLMFGWQVGAVVAAFGTFFANLMSGFSGWAALVPYYMINMALAAVCFGIASKKCGKIVGLIVGTFVNTLCILPWLVMLGWQMMITTLSPRFWAPLLTVCWQSSPTPPSPLPRTAERWKVTRLTMTKTRKSLLPMWTTIPVPASLSMKMSTSSTPTPTAVS